MAGDPRGPIDSRRLVAPPRMEPVTNYPPPLDAGVLDTAAIVAAAALDGAVLEAMLAVAVAPLSRADRLWVERVACLGGTVDQTALVLFEHRLGRSPQDPERRARNEERYAHPEEYATSEELDDIYIMRHLRRLVRDQFAEHWDQVRGEFDGMDPLVRAHFKPTEDASELETLEHYQKLRPMYCSFGIDDPKGVVFDQLRDSRFLGRRVVVHHKVADQLDDLADTLEDKREGLSEEMRLQVKTAAGFSPRLVANRRAISNHALGLALDINADYNSHIVDQGSIAIIKQITATENFGGFDFGKPLVVPEDQQLDDEAARQAKIEEIKEIHAKSMQASDLVRAWLKEQLDREMKGKFDLDQLAKQVQEWRDKITQAADLAEAEGYRAGYEQANLTLASEIAKFNSNADQQRLEALRRIEGEAKIQIWARDGLRSLPLDLVITLVVDLKFTWGDEFDDSKDGMHFDFLKDTDGGVIIRKQRFQSLKDLLDRGPEGM